MAQQSTVNTKKSNINRNFQIILTECIYQETSNTNNNSINIPNIDYARFISLNCTEFCKLLSDSSSISQGRGCKIHTLIKQKLHEQTNDNNSDRYQMRLDSKLRDQLHNLHWIHLNDNNYTEELINECWNQILKNNKNINKYCDINNFESKIAVMLFTLISDQRISSTLYTLFNDSSSSSNMCDMFINKSLKAVKNTHYNKALLYLDNAEIFNNNKDKLYKLYLLKSDCYFKLKDYQNSVLYAKKCIKIEPDLINPYIKCGNAYIELQQCNDAQHMFKKAEILTKGLQNNNNNSNTANIRDVINDIGVGTLLGSPLIYKPILLDDNNINNGADYLVSKWLKHVLNGKNDKIMSFEASQIKSCCNNYKRCPCLYRLLNAIKIYQIWNEKYMNNNNWTQCMTAVLKEMRYSESILNDFFHVLRVHNNQSDLFKYIKTFLNINCRDNMCRLYKRNYRNRDKCRTIKIRKELYYGMHENYQISLLKQLDSIHSYLLHHVSSTGNDNDNDISSVIFTKYITSVQSVSEFKSFRFGESFDYKNDIVCKYSTLKQEMLSNSIYHVSNYQWNDVYIRCTKLQKTVYISTKLIAHNSGLHLQSTSIQSGSIITIDHLIALYFSINYINLLSLFQSSGCRLMNNESLTSLHSRHCEISNCLLKLRESVWFYGEYAKQNEYFYHAFNKKILFNKFNAICENYPLFTIKNNMIMKRLSQYNSGINNILFEFSSSNINSIGYPYFNCDYLSDFNNMNTNDTLFFQCKLQINDIYLLNKSYKIYLKSLFLFQKITKGLYINQNAHDNKLNIYQNCVINMMNNHRFIHKKHLLYNKNDNDNDIKANNNDNPPAYIQELFEYYCATISNNEIWFIQSEINKLDPKFKNYLFSDNNSNKLGYFLNIWCINNNKLSIKFVYEFNWKITGNMLNKYNKLGIEQPLTGPLFIIQLNDTNKDDDDDIVINNNNNDINISSCIVFVPFCRKSTKRAPDYGEFGLLIQSLPSNIKSILFEYQVQCSEASYSLSVPPQKWMKINDTIAFTSFQTSNMHNNISFTYSVALKIMRLSYVNDPIVHIL